MNTNINTNGVAQKIDDYITKYCELNEIEKDEKKVMLMPSVSDPLVTDIYYDSVMIGTLTTKTTREKEGLKVDIEFESVNPN